MRSQPPSSPRPSTSFGNSIRRTTGERTRRFGGPASRKSTARTDGRSPPISCRSNRGDHHNRARLPPRRTTPLPAALARRQDAARLCRPRRQRAGARVPVQPGDTSGGDAGQGAHAGRGAADRRQHREVAGATRKGGLRRGSRPSIRPFRVFSQAAHCIFRDLRPWPSPLRGSFSLRHCLS